MRMQWIETGRSFSSLEFWSYDSIKIGRFYAQAQNYSVGSFLGSWVDFGSAHSLHKLRNQPMKMMCALFARDRVATMGIKSRAYSFLHILHYIFIFQFYFVQVCARALS